MRSLTTLELVKHGDDFFPFAVYSLKKTERETIFDLHWHSELEFLYVLNGSGLFVIDEFEYKLSKGQGLIINGGVLHRASAMLDQNCEIVALVFDPILLSGSNNDRIKLKYINPVLESLRYMKPILDINNELDSLIINGFMDVATIAIKKKPMFELYVKIELLRVFSLLFNFLDKDSKNGNREIRESNKSINIKEALLYIHTYYNQSITLKDIASAAGMSEAYFSRTFKVLVGKTVFEYLNYYKINCSVELMRQTKLPISIIANEIGYESSSYFIKQFKKILHETPKIYRETYIKT